MRDGEASPPAAGIIHRKYEAAGCTGHVLHSERASLPLPGIVYFYGGGWVLGDFSTHARLVTDIVKRTGAASGPADLGCRPLAPHAVGPYFRWFTLTCSKVRCRHTLGDFLTRPVTRGFPSFTLHFYRESPQQSPQFSSAEFLESCE